MLLACTQALSPLWAHIEWRCVNCGGGLAWISICTRSGAPMPASEAAARRAATPSRAQLASAQLASAQLASAQRAAQGLTPPTGPTPTIGAKELARRAQCPVQGGPPSGYATGGAAPSTHAAARAPVEATGQHKGGGRVGLRVGGGRETCHDDVPLGWWATWAASFPGMCCAIRKEGKEGGADG